MPANDANGNPLQLDLGSIPPSVDVLSLTTTEIESQDEPSEPTESLPCRPLMIYTRPQILHLQSSPLVKSPPDMPELKHWFGEHEPSLGKKDSEPTTPNSTRDRRFRRDAEDGETSTRPSFRSTLSQPSQMGNFKHQSLRDRDRDRDGDKDRERDIRDKEGQERLRNLSDKYDRDRLAAPSALRKERDIAPHLAADSTIRGSASLSTPGRRTEGRDGAKKKVGEVSEDWRRGGDARRQDRYENSRGNREDRERPRSRGRDSSRPRRDVSSSRRDRDRDTEDRELGGDRRDDHRKQPRDDNRRTRDDHRRNGMNTDESATGTPLSAIKMRVKTLGDGGMTGNEMREWQPGVTLRIKERDGRSKRNHRDRRTGATADDGKDREDRRDREREKEKEKDLHGWTLTSPILLKFWGVKVERAEWTAFKSGRRIQLFKMLMKREEEKKQVDASVSENTVALMDTAPPPPGIRVQQKVSKITPKAVSQIRTTMHLLLQMFFPNPINAQNAASNAEKVTTDPPWSLPLRSSILRKDPVFWPSAPVLRPNQPAFLNPPTVQTPTRKMPALSIPPFQVRSESLRTGFSPFEDQSRMSFGLEEPRDHGKAFLGTPEPMRRGGDDRHTTWDWRLVHTLTQSLIRLLLVMPQARAVGWPNSLIVQRPNLVSPNSAPSSGGISFGQQAQNNLQMLQQQQQQPSHLHLHSNNRLDSLYESRLDDRNFMPDGMVPGLRSAPPPRSRDSAVIYSDSIDDAIHFNQPRLPPQHHRGLDQMYGPVPSVYPQQGGRNAGIPMQPQYRGGPSPISNPQQQRLPPGLANLGGRPPLDGSQFIGMPGLPSPGLHTGMQPQMRVPGSTTHPLQGGVQHHQLASLGHPNLDLRGPNHNQAQLLGLGGGGMRGIGIGGFGPQGPAQMQQPLHVMRQQQEQQQRQQQQQQLHQQQLPPHMMPHHLQVGHPHQQQGPNNQTDLMALLMGGTAHRE
ncbi:hypothetical protein B0H10DRAFT_2185434 [Mycena sp. CBHHK59/15]|nr:hypothetical protein B0H10DRAFT_2185434 [Mycena sp. CBHHK59/15]